MRQIIIQIIGISLLAAIVFQPVQASDEKSLENRIIGWLAAVNEGNYNLCLNYVAPPKFTGQRGLTRMMISGGEELLLFSGEKLFPLSKYKINKIEFLNDGYESKVTLDAKVIYQRKPLYIRKEETPAAGEYDMLVYPATIVQRWILLNGSWFIKSIIRLQYLGS